MVYNQTANEEELLQKHCEELEQRLRQDALSFENEALEVQLNQIQDDHTQLQEELRSTWEFYTKRVSDMTSQLEDRERMTCTAEGHADCLSDLLVFHEDNGVLAGSYWRAQCEKRDDSIRFLSLKLQEYTVPSAEYHSRPANSGPQGFNPVHSPPDTSPSTSSRSEKSPAFGGGAAKGHPGAMKAAERAYQALSERHSRLCEEVQAAQARAASLERDIEACEQRRRTLMRAPETGDPGTPKFVEDASEDKRFESDEVSMPTWATRCAWRDELDLRAGQLERTSLQFDATKRSLDAANEELQWQATSAEALRTRLTDVLRATSAEERRAQEAFAEEARRCSSLQDLLQRWAKMKPGAPLPPAFLQAQQLLRLSESREEEPRAGATEREKARGDPKPPAN